MMRCILIALGTIILTFARITVVLAYGTLIPSSNPNTQAFGDMAFSRRASTASNAADLAQAAAVWINQLVVRKVVDKAIEAENNSIKNILRTTGQPGVLYRVDIQKVDGEIPVFSVVGNGVQFIGAGSSPLGVNSAINQQDQLRPAPSPGAAIDLEKSFFIWFAKDANGILATVIPAYSIISETARRYADRKLLEASNSADQARTVEAAVKYTETIIKDKAAKARIEALNKDQQATNYAVKQIGEKLTRELERLNRAQHAAATLSMLAGVLNLASQIGTLSTELGSDMPASAKNAASSADLENIIKDVVGGSQANVDSLQIKYKSLIDKRKNIMVDYLEILRKSNYPVTQVPELGISAAP